MGTVTAANSALLLVELHAGCRELLLPTATTPKTTLLEGLNQGLARVGITRERSPLPDAIAAQLALFAERGETAPLSTGLIAALTNFRTTLEGMPIVGALLTESEGPDTLLGHLLTAPAMAESAAGAMVWGAELAIDPTSRGKAAAFYAQRLEALTTSFQEQGESRERALYLASVTLGNELIGVADGLLREAYIDSLTSVMTRGAGMRLVREAIIVDTTSVVPGQTPRQPCLGHVLVMVDIDHFRDLNNTHGHLFGDKVLREIGKVLRTTVRPDDVVLRYGGEEFGILLRETDMNGAASVIRRVQEQIRQLEFVTEGTTVRPTVSFGYAPMINGVKSEADIEARVRQSLGRADAALYNAKRGTLTGGNGRNQVVAWTQEMGETPPKV